MLTAAVAEPGGPRDDARMPDIVRPWSGAHDTQAMQRLASRCWPDGLHPGGLGWAHATDQLAAEIVVVDDGDGVAGWAGVTQPGSLAMQVAPERPEVTGALVGWLLDAASGSELTIDTYDGATRAAFGRRGFARVEPPYGYYRMGDPGVSAAVAAVSGPTPAGYEIRSVRPGEAGPRVDAHRTAWRPADLPIHPDHRPEMDQTSTSSFTLDAYRRVQATWLYDPELDLVVVAPDGSLAGCCIGWYDRDTGWVEIEPLGVDPAHRRRGLAGALCAEIAARTARLGGRQVFVNTGPSDMYPAPFATYAKAGFRPYVRGVTLRRHRPGVSG